MSCEGDWRLQHVFCGSDTRGWQEAISQLLCYFLHTGTCLLATGCRISDVFKCILLVGGHVIHQSASSSILVCGVWDLIKSYDD